MVDMHYFIFIVNADTVVLASVIFGMSFIALRLVYKMWRASLRCPHCGGTLRTHPAALPPPAQEAQSPSLWT
ncbi:hypothetical protein E6H29_06415 [Candidatus Bathyarchaeota archaeon]|nr:MAG: hypothetical protein E6H29_06415 [Candidatus Bathyarchaeota archaeon]